MKDYVVNSIALKFFDVGATYIKGYINTMFKRKANQKTSIDLLCGIRSRVTDLEIKAAKRKKKTPEVSAKAWESISDVCKRATQLPQCGDVVRGLIREGVTCNIQSVEKAGKSLISWQIAHEYTSNEPSLLVPREEESTSSVKCSAFIYDAELQDYNIYERYNNLQDSKVLRQKAHFKTPEDMLNDMRGTLKTVNANTLMVVDNASTICPSFSQQDIENLRLGLEELKATFLMRGFWLTIIFVHHTKSGKDGDDTKDRAGSVHWGRVADDNISLKLSGRGVEFRELKNLNGRSKDALLKAGESILLKLVGVPYPHFEYEQTILNGNVPQPHGKDEEGKGLRTRDWKSIVENEHAYITEHYKPYEYGAGRLATDILERQGISKDKSSVGCLKSAITNALKSDGIYQSEDKK